MYLLYIIISRGWTTPFIIECPSPSLHCPPLQSVLWTSVHPRSPEAAVYMLALSIPLLYGAWVLKSKVSWMQRGHGFYPVQQPLPLIGSLARLQRTLTGVL